MSVLGSEEINKAEKEGLSPVFNLLFDVKSVDKLQQYLIDTILEYQTLKSACEENGLKNVFTDIEERLKLLNKEDPIKVTEK